MARLALKDLLDARAAPAAPELAEPLPDRAVRCLACGHRCAIRDGARGICQIRFNRGGVLHAPRGYVAALQCDPIEKKPFYHAFPGRDALSFGMLGCNLHCAFCKYWVSSQALRDPAAGAGIEDVAAGAVVDAARRCGAPVVVSTYNEPLVTAEWAVEIFRLARAVGLACGFVSNGHASEAAVDYLRPWMDLFKVDLKCFSDRRYRELGGAMANVLGTIERLVAKGFWVEVVTLVVPGFNDAEEELRGIARFLAGVSRDIPWHVTAFHPDYRRDAGEATSAAQLRRAAAIGQEAGLRFVYAGNRPGELGDLEHTRCPGCRAVLIERSGFRVLANRLKAGACPSCGTAIPGRWGDKKDE
jgi:pyruvate formate lyase activating enzyme